MSKVVSGGKTHPLAEELFSIITVLYKGQEEKQICSEERLLKACSDLLNNGIFEWQDKDNFLHFGDLPEAILKDAIWRIPDRIETAEELKAHLLPTHLKNAIRAVLEGESYSSLLLMAFDRIERGLTTRASIPLSVWNAALSISPAVRKRNLALQQESSHEISGVQLDRLRNQRQGIAQQCNDHPAVPAAPFLTS